MDAALQDSGSLLKKTETWESPHIPPEITLDGPFFSALIWCQQMEGQLGSLSHVTTIVVVPLHAQITHSHIPLFCHMFVPHGPDRPGPRGWRGGFGHSHSSHLGGWASSTVANWAGSVSHTPIPRLPWRSHPNYRLLCPAAGGHVWRHSGEPCLLTARLLMPCRNPARPPLSWAVRPALTLNGQGRSGK